MESGFLSEISKTCGPLPQPGIQQATGAVGWCGDGLCSGGVDPNPDPQKQVYPGHISVPLGCQCRTCGGACYCRRCACSVPTSTDRRDTNQFNDDNSKKGIAEPENSCCSPSAAQKSVGRSGQPLESHESESTTLWGQEEEQLGGQEIIKFQDAAPGKPASEIENTACDCCNGVKVSKQF